MQENNLDNNDILQEQLLRNNNEEENTLIIDKDFFIPWTSLGTKFGIYNEYYSVYKNSPRKTSLFFFFQSLFFPNLSILSITFFIGIINIIIFSITIFFGIETTNKEDFLTPKMITLNKFGYFDPYLIKEN